MRAIAAVLTASDQGQNARGKQYWRVALVKLRQQGEQKIMLENFYMLRVGGTHCLPRPRVGHLSGERQIKAPWMAKEVIQHALRWCGTRGCSTRRGALEGFGDRGMQMPRPISGVMVHPSSRCMASTSRVFLPAERAQAE